MIWLAMVPVFLLWLSLRQVPEQASFTVMPQVPRPGEPLYLSLLLTAPPTEAQDYRYSIYANGELLHAGMLYLEAGDEMRTSYLYPYAPGKGQQANFVAKVSAGEEELSYVVSLPPYPPQIFSSFVSFASFSTSIMGSISTSIVYEDYFGPGLGLTVGLVLILTLLGLSLFQELTYPLAVQQQRGVLTRLHLRFLDLVFLLLFVFMGMVFTLFV